MAKKAESKPVTTVWDSKAVVCQCCRFHGNNPSTCTSTGLPVGRKQKGCDSFIRVK